MSRMETGAMRTVEARGFDGNMSSLLGRDQNPRCPRCGRSRRRGRRRTPGEGRCSPLFAAVRANGLNRPDSPRTGARRRSRPVAAAGLAVWLLAGWLVLIDVLAPEALLVPLVVSRPA